MKWWKWLDKAADWVPRLFYWGMTSGLVFFWFFGMVANWCGDKVLADKLMFQALCCLVALVFLEVRKLKQWGANNLATLMEVADVAGKKVDELKAHGWSVTISNREE